MRFFSKSDCSFYFAYWLVVFGRRQEAVITHIEGCFNCTPCVYLFIEGGRTIAGEDKTSQWVYVHSLHAD